MQVDLPLAVPRLGVVHLSPPSLLADVDARAVRRNVWDLDTESFSEAQPRRCAEYEEHAVLVPQFAFHVHVAFGVPVRVLPRGHDAGDNVARKTRGSLFPGVDEIGRASCRERVGVWVGGGRLEEYR